MLIILVWLVRFLPTLSFNFDTQSPLVKQINKDVYFGFSVAQHILKATTNTPYILVGAPLDSTFFNGAVFNRSGAIYKCPISFDRADCQQIPVNFLTKDSDEMTEGGLWLDGDLKEQFKGRMFENQWLGVTVSSSGQGSFSACAHKYVHYYNFTNLDAHATYGACYRFSNSFFQEYKHVPCLLYSHSVKIFYSNNYAFCQAGTSLSVVEDTSLQSSNQLDTYLSFGMPGALNSRGLVAVKTIGKNSQNDYIYKNRSYCKFDIENDEAMIDGYCPSLWEKYSYTGMSHVLIRKYRGNPRVNLIASGSPRESLHGLVRLFTIMFDSSFGPVTKLLSVKLNGWQKGAYFGFSMCACDVNGDGLEDLIVGAPYFSKKNEPDSGRVYVYLNDLILGFRDEYVVDFGGKARSLFGHALTCLGDIDKDGSADFAIGAPYENFGAVYVVRGNKEVGKINVSQVIRSEDLNERMEAFGYSLSGGLDMDSNLYPDLAIGALKSNKVVLLRTRPVVKVGAYVHDLNNLAQIDQTIKNCDLEDNLFVCFKFDICFQAEPSQLGQLPLLNFTLLADAESRGYARVFFRDSGSNLVKKQIFVSDVSPSCESVEVVIKKDANDFVRPIKFKVEYGFVEDRSYQSNGDLDHIQKIPLVHQDSMVYEFEANFKKECGSDNKCETDLQLKAHFLDLMIDDENVAVLSFRERDSVTIAVEISNTDANAEPAYAAQIDVEFDQRLDFIRKTESEPSGFSCDLISKKIVCKITSDQQGIPLGTNKIARFNLTFSSTRLYRYANISSQSNIFFKMEAKTLSQDVDMSNNIVELHAMVKVRANLFLYGAGTPEQVFYSDRFITRGESSMQKLEQIGPIIEHTYNINNGGPFSVHNFHLIIDWPYESRLVNFDIENNLQFVAGKHLLYLIEKPTKIPNNHPINVVCTSFYVDTLRISELKQIQKRSVYQDSAIKAPLKHQDLSRTAIIDCFSNTAYCHKINCSFSGEFSNDETISLKLTARLWNTTLVEDYPDYERVFIKSHARLYLGEDVHDDKPDDNENSVATIAYSRISIKLEKKLPLSVYLISIAIGVFLFIISTIGFYMLGFFERKKFGDDKYLEESDKVKKVPY
ncbi:integrin alpha-PS1 isoform X2 [Brachionus plicatilis]|uniref:Integrin alpha-PS1 isoform X2 n=1 Tax=Brachionus plicatilis TaxID=10195 RepID=A0A3M7T751_BRAPC|nr:integrin alpha-PS1 isoform X2 [Brachionus plicatilis]